MGETRHEVRMEQRENIFITGVNDVISFDEQNVIVDTQMDLLIITGENLHVNKLNLEEGELSIDGQIISMRYEAENNFGKVKSSFLGKIFK